MVKSKWSRVAAIKVRPPSLLLALSKRLKMFGGFKQNKKKSRMERFIKQRLEKQIFNKKSILQ
tara:strand:- start:86 stop:274 length:189 start_codon:yes stop_codon:yes gene_type:complete